MEDVILNPASSRVKDLTKVSAKMKLQGCYAGASRVADPTNCLEGGNRRTVPRAGFAAAQDDIVEFGRESSHALAYFHET